MFRPMLSFVFFASFSCLQTAHASGPDYVIVRTVIDAVMQPKSPGDAFKECANDALCRTLADGVASYLGVQPGAVSAAMAVVPKVDRAGEDSTYSIELPSGYQYCRSSIRTISVVPASGDRASAMGATSNQRGVGIYTWTPRRGLGGKKSWVEAEYTIYGVRYDIAEQKRADGTCRPYGRQLIDCRGAKGISKGMPACGLSAD